MIAVLKSGTTAEQTTHLVNWLKNMGLDVHISEGHEFTVLGLVGDTSRVDMDLLNRDCKASFRTLQAGKPKVQP